MSKIKTPVEIYNDLRIKRTEVILMATLRESFTKDEYDKVARKLKKSKKKHLAEQVERGFPVNNLYLDMLNRVMDEVKGRVFHE